MNPTIKNTRRPLAPAFISRFDNWLLRNYPDIWSLRTHLLLYYGLLAYLVLGALCWLVPDDPRTESHAAVWSACAGLLSGIALVVWLIYLFRFNVFKRYGQLASGDRLRTFLSYFISFVLFALFVMIPPFVDKVRTELLYPQEEVVQDINEINLYINILEKGNFPINFYYDTLQVVATQEEANRLSMNKPIELQHTEYIEKSQMEWRLSNGDSVKQIASGKYVLITMTPLNFISKPVYYYGEKTETYNSVRLYDLVYKKKVLLGNDEVAHRLDVLKKKYYHTTESGISYNGYDYDMPVIDQENLMDHLDNKYDLREIRTSLYHIHRRERMFRPRDTEVFVRAIGYFALAATLLLFAFRHTTIKTFFVSILAGVILAIITGLIIAFIRFDEIVAAVLMIVYFVIFLVLALSIPFSKKRSLVKGVALNFALILTFPIPVICVALYYSWVRMQYYGYGYLYYTGDNSEYIDKIANREWHFHLAEYVGIPVLLVMVGFVFSGLYRKWYAQPEE